MKVRGSRAPDKIEMQMSAMIDVVFQLLIFFMLTLKIVEPEGDFSVNMPIGQAPQTSDEPPPIVLNVKMTSNPQTGELESLRIANKELFANIRVQSSDPVESQRLRAEAAFKQLNQEILNQIGDPDSPLVEDPEVEIDADYELNSKYLINAIGACRGAIRKDAAGKEKMVDYVKNIKFAPPHPKRTP